MNDQLSKFEGSDIIRWAKDLKHNEKVAKKYEGVTTVKDILKKAKEDGYNFTEKELLDFNLDLVAGGTGDTGSGNTTGDITGLDLDIGDKTQSHEQTHSESINNLDLQAKVNGTGHSFNISNNNNVAQK